jgi:hypothetical protein
MVRYIYDYIGWYRFEDIRADLPNLPKPENTICVNSREEELPDVTGIMGGLNIIEVETEDSIFNEHTKRQWRLFASYAKANNALFSVVVPAGSRESALKRTKELGIVANIWEVKSSLLDIINV